jgi:cytochrome c oxidase subunit 2
MIPGRTNRLLLYADRPGRYRGQCSEHAHMGFYVFADPPERFRDWLAGMAASRRAHVGPDLTHLASRTTLAGLTIPNTKGYLRGWVLDPQHVKPGNRMPGLELSGGEVNDLLCSPTWSA